nr:hypothetical protein [uncultured Kingella sp.]
MQISHALFEVLAMSHYRYILGFRLPLGFCKGFRLPLMERQRLVAK